MGTRPPSAFAVASTFILLSCRHGSLSVLLLITPGRWPSSSSSSFSSSPVTPNWACCYLKAYDVKEKRSDIFLPDEIMNERWLVS